MLARIWCRHMTRSNIRCGSSCGSRRTGSGVLRRHVGAVKRALDGARVRCRTEYLLRLLSRHLQRVRSLRGNFVERRHMYTHENISTFAAEDGTSFLNIPDKTMPPRWWIPSLLGDVSPVGSRGVGSTNTSAAKLLGALMVWSLRGLVSADETSWLLVVEGEECAKKPLLVALSVGHDSGQEHHPSSCCCCCGYTAAVRATVSSLCLGWC